MTGEEIGRKNTERTNRGRGKPRIPMNWVRLLVSVGALVILFWKIGLSETVAVLQQADLRYWLAGLVLFLLSLFVRACRWRVLIQGLGLHVPFGRLIQLYFVGAFFNAFLPSQFGGDVVRALELTQDTDSAVAVGTVLLDRMSGLLVLFAMGLGVLPFYAGYIPPSLTVLILVVAAGGLTVGALILQGHLLRRWTARLPSILSLGGEGPLAKIYAAVTGCGRQAVWRAAAISLAFNLLNILINWLCSRTVGASVHLGYFFAVTPLLSVAGMIPSMGGWGVREAVSTVIFTPLGVDANVAAAIGLALGGINLTTGLIGGLLYGLQSIIALRRSPRTTPSENRR